MGNLSAKVRRAGGAGYPKGFLPGASQIYEADVGVPVVVGSAVSTWFDQSGNGFNLTVPPDTPPNLPVPTAPLWLKDSDQKPYVKFDGIANILANTVLPNYVGTALTLYMVARPFFVGVGIGEKVAMALTRAGVICGTGAGTIKLGRNPGETQIVARRDGIQIDCRNDPPSANEQWAGTWAVYAFRAAVLSQDIAFWHLFCNGNWGGDQYGAPGTAPLAFHFDRFSLGGVVDLTPGFPNDMLRVDMRAAAVYRLAHSDQDMKNTLRYLAHKWGVPILD